MTGIAAADLERALGALTDFFRDRQTRAGVIARRELGITTDTDDRLVDQLIRERRRRTRLDGGIGGWVIATTWSAWELLQLGCSPDHTGLNRMLGYLLSRQDQPGRFGEGCSEKRHAIGLCQHHLRGFFSVGSRDEKVAPLALPSGVVVNDEWEARLAASCFALRVVLQAGLDRRESVRHHLEGLLALSERWERQEFDASRDLLFFALGAVAMAPLQYRDRIRTLSERVLEEQTDTGLWPGTSLFHAVETLLLLPTKAGVEAVRRSLPAVMREQRPSGAFDDADNEEMALIALRALRAQGVPRVSPRPPRFNRTVIRQ